MKVRVRSKIQRGHREAGKTWSREWQDWSGEVTEVMNGDNRLDIEITPDADLMPLNRAALVAIAQPLGIDCEGLTKAELRDAITAAAGG